MLEPRKGTTMTIQNFRTGVAKTERLHAEAKVARLANTAHRVRFATWLRGIANRIAPV